MTHYNIGIDTGGTYTDAVIIETHSKAVVATAKALTTKANLAIGIVESINKVLQACPQIHSDHINVVALSTTLATNALVEGQGVPVAVVLIGFDDTMVERTELAQALPQVPIIRIAGGHRYDGSEYLQLDEVSLRKALSELTADIQAFAVASIYSIRNPAHEQRAQAIIKDYFNVPITASYELSDALNGPRRALTATFNARIIALIVDLVNAVKKVMTAQGIQAPLMIVKGDGSIASAESVMSRPIETILSGPAASVIGASFLSGQQDFLIADIGGTTTDVALVRNGWPALNQKGAWVGQHRTMVKAIDMKTLGLGGDSEVQITPAGDIQLKTNRVVPVSLVGAYWPSVEKSLQAEMAEGRSVGMGSMFVMRPRGYQDKPVPNNLGMGELDLLNSLTDEPVIWSAAVASVRDRYRLQRLHEQGLVQIAGFTPSDAAHLLGLQNQWSRSAAFLAATLVGRNLGKISYNDATLEAEVLTFAHSVFDAVVTKSTHILLSSLSGIDFLDQDPLVAAIAKGQAQLGDLLLTMRPVMPIVAVGGPAPIFYPEVGKRLGVESIIPEHCEVSNALGAAVGLVKVHCQIEISKTEQGSFLLHGLGEPIVAHSPEAAIQQAQTLAHGEAVRLLQHNGAHLLETQVKISDRVDIPDLSGETGLISARVIAESTGRVV